MTAKIIIIEDEFLIAMAMEDAVRDLGYEVQGIADTLQSALNLARSGADVALVDVNLADGATGPTIGERLADEFGVNVVFVTANPAQLGDGVAGTLGAVEKPVETTELGLVLDYAVARSQGRGMPPPPSLRLFGGAQAA